MKKCKHKLILLRHFFYLNFKDEWIYYKCSRCYKCKEVIEDRIPVSINDVNRYSHIKIMKEVT